MGCVRKRGRSWNAQVRIAGWRSLTSTFEKKLDAERWVRETEYNIKMMGDLFKFMKDYKSKIVMYQYDSFLIDFNLVDGKDFLLKAKNIIEQNGKFPVKVAYGKDYNEMKDFTEKLYAH